MAQVKKDSFTNPKPSILNRKPLKMSQRNAQSDESSWTKFEKNVETRKSKNMELYNYRFASMYGTTEDKRLLHSTLKKEADAQLELKSQQKSSEVLREEEELRKVREYQRMQEQKRRQMEEEKRQMIVQMQQENIRLSEQKKVDSFHNKIKQDSVDRVEVVKAFFLRPSIR